MTGEIIPRSVEEYRVWWTQNTDIEYGHCWCGCGEETDRPKITNTAKMRFRNEPMRFKHGHNPRKCAPNFKPISIEDRGHTSPCWIWKGSFKRGYPSSFRDYKQRRPYRDYYEDKYGSIPAGMHIHHLCEIPACVNPDHVTPITPADHNRIHPNTKLTFELSRQMKRRCQETNLTQEEVAKEFGVSRQTVSKVIRGKLWSDKK